MTSGICESPRSGSRNVELDKSRALTIDDRPLCLPLRRQKVAFRFTLPLYADNAWAIHAMYDNAMSGNSSIRVHTRYANSSAEIFISRMFVTGRALSE